MIYKGIELKLAVFIALAIFIAVKHQGKIFAGLHLRAVFCTLARSVLDGIFFRMVLFHQH
jgi:hypothetical protein